MSAAEQAWAFLTKHREIPYGIFPDFLTDIINDERDQINTLEMLIAVIDLNQ